MWRNRSYSTPGVHLKQALVSYNINMDVLFWYLVKSDASVRLMYISVDWTSHI